MKIRAIFKDFFGKKTSAGKSIQDFINTPQDITDFFTPSSFQASSSGNYSQMLDDTLLSVLSEFADQYITQLKPDITQLQPDVLKEKKEHLIHTLVNFAYQKLHFTSHAFKIPDQKSPLPVENNESVTDFYGQTLYRKKVTKQEAETFYNELTCGKVVNAMLDKLTNSFMADIHAANTVDKADAVLKRLVSLAGNHRDKFVISNLSYQFYGFYTVEKLKTGTLNPEQKKIIKEEGIDKGPWNNELYYKKGSEEYYKLLKNVCAALQDYPLLKLDKLSKRELKCCYLLTKELFEKLGMGSSEETTSPQTVLKYIHDELMKLLNNRNECKEAKAVTPQMRREQQLKAIYKRLEKSSDITEAESFFGNGKVLSVCSNVKSTQFCTLDQILYDPVHGKNVKSYDEMKNELRHLIYFIILEGKHIKLDRYKTLDLPEHNKCYWFFPRNFSLCFADALNRSSAKTSLKTAVTEEDMSIINEFLQPQSKDKHEASAACFPALKR